MPLPGGPADKLGNRYELWWTVWQLVRLLDGRADSIRIEDPGVTKAEFVISRGGRWELHQAKRSHPDGKWSLASLAASDMRLLQAIHAQLTGNDDRFVFVSSSDARELADLAERSQQAESLQEFEEKFLAAKETRNHFERLQRYWSNASVATAFEILRRIELRAMDDEVIPLQTRIETVADDADLEEVYNTERHLLYVACTRARDHLLVTSVDPSSEFLDDLRM
jgi:superfamily I DNA/RNA helicase